MYRKKKWFKLIFCLSGFLLQNHELCCVWFCFLFSHHAYTKCFTDTLYSIAISYFSPASIHWDIYKYWHLSNNSYATVTFWTNPILFHLFLIWCETINKKVPILKKRLNERDWLLTSKWKIQKFTISFWLSLLIYLSHLLHIREGHQYECWHKWLKWIVFIVSIAQFVSIEAIILYRW